jgi:hypothetical protein
VRARLAGGEGRELVHVKRFRSGNRSNRTLSTRFRLASSRDVLPRSERSDRRRDAIW